MTLRPLPPAKSFETNAVSIPTEDGVLTEVLLTYVPSAGADAHAIREMVTAEGAVDMRVPLDDVDMLCAALQEAKDRALRTDDPPSSLQPERTNEQA